MSKTQAEKLLIGAHCSTAGGLENALLEGQEIGATTIQFFTSNQKQWKGREINDEMAQLFIETKKATGMKKIMSHSSYLINLGSPKKESIEKSRAAFRQEIERCHKLEVEYLNFHPGAALDSSVEECLDRITESLKTYENLCEKADTRLLLEATAGQGSSVGHKFEHLDYIIDRVKGKIPIGVCIDTCHIFAAGYDMRDKKSLDATVEQFDDIVGLSHLYGFHVNDSMKPFESRRDRHAHLGKGEIGLEGF